MSEKTIRLLVPTFMLLYFGVGFGRWIGGLHEIYPIGAWGMFHRIPRSVEVYDLRIHRHRGVDHDPPFLASEVVDEPGISLDGHRLLVLNGFATHTRKGRAAEAVPYRTYLDRVVVGPDSKYEVLRHRRRTSDRGRRVFGKSSHGPFETPIRFEGEPPISEHFDFPEKKRFERLRKDEHRRLKSKKPSY